MNKDRRRFDLGECGCGQSNRGKRNKRNLFHFLPWAFKSIRQLWIDPVNSLLHASTRSVIISRNKGSRASDSRRDCKTEVR